MARAATTTDVFMPWRSLIVDALGAGERSVTELVEGPGLSQPQMSKHLAVLRAVVQVRQDGQRRLCRLNGGALKSIHDWVSGFAALWHERLDQPAVAVEELKRQNKGDGADGE